MTKHSAVSPCRAHPVRRPAPFWLAGAILLAAAAPAFATDTDGDGLEDTDELTIYGTDPNDADTDDDGWNDDVELIQKGTIAVLADSDGDTTNDPSDATPMVNGTATHGGAPAGTGFLTSRPYAYSGQSPYDGVNVCVANGKYHTTFSVGGSAGAGALEAVLTLHYDSSASVNGYTGNWSSILDTYCVEQPNGDVKILAFDGVEELWELDNGDYVAAFAGCLDTVEKTGGVFIRTTPSGYKVTYGSIDKVEDPSGNVLDFTYTSGRPSSITDPSGDVHTLSYYTQGRLEKLAMADGGEWKFFYNINGQLWKVTGPTTTSFSGGIEKEFRYTNGATSGAQNGNLLAQSDGNGEWWLRNEYDTSDRVKKQWVGAGNLTFDYTNIGTQKTLVTDREGNEREWEWHSTKLTKTKLTERTNRNLRTGEGDYATEWTHDADGYLTEVEHPRGNGVEYTLNSAKLATEVRRKTDVDASNSSSDLVDTYAYDSSKNWGMTSHTDPEGNVTTYTLDSVGRVTQVSHPTLTHVTPNVTVTESFAYNADGTLDTITDGEGTVTKHEYFTTGVKKGLLKKRITDYGTGKLNLTTEYDYEAWGSVKSVKDPRANTTTYTVERYGNVEKVEGPSTPGYVSEFDYDGNLNPTVRRVKNIDHDGTWLSSPQWWTTEWEYSAMEKVTKVTEQISSTTERETTTGYTGNDEPHMVIRDGRKLRLTYDERGLLFKRERLYTGLSDLTETMDYDGNRNLTAHENARGKTSTFEYDLFDRRTKAIDPLGNYAETIYDECGDVAEEKFYDENGTTDTLMSHRKLTRDAMCRVWKTEDALIGSSSTSWYARTVVHDKRGLVTKATDRRSYDTLFVYDAAGRRTKTTDAVGNEVQLEYDANGNVIEVTEVEKVPGSSSTESFVTEFEYDNLNRQVKRTEIDRTNSANTKVTEWKRSALGLRKTIDPRGYAVTLTLDGLGRVKEKSEEISSTASAVTAYELNVHDEVTKLTDDNGSETVYTYSGHGFLTQKLYESGKTVAYAHDANGNVTLITDQSGTETDQTFDDCDRLLTRDLTLATGVGGDTDEDFAYDAMGRLLEALDDDSTVTLTYDSLSRVTGETQGPNPLGSSGKTVSYTYDAEGNRTKIDYPDGFGGSAFDANESRDALGRLSSVTDGGSNQIAAFDLYGAGARKKKVTLANSTTANYAWDGFRRPTDIDHKDSGGTRFAGFAYAWDKSDNPLMEARSHKSGKGDVYSYDRANRLIKTLRDVDDPAAELASPGTEVYDKKLDYAMDDVLNLTSYTVTPYGGSATSTSYTTNSMNEYTAVGGVTHTYTDNGALAGDGTYTYKYDGRDRLIEVKQGSTTVATYAYDALGLGRRTKKTVGSATTKYLYAGQQSIEELDGSGTLLRLFVFGDRIDEILAMDAPDAADVDGDSNTSEVLRFSYHTQLIGSVTHVTAPSGALAEQYEYDPYGKVTIKDGSGSTLTASAIGNAYTFTARQLDEETGLYYYRARTYSPDLRRFIQRDPLEYVDGPNALGYCGGQVATATDPSGEITSQSSHRGDKFVSASGIEFSLERSSIHPNACGLGGGVTVFAQEVTFRNPDYCHRCSYKAEAPWDYSGCTVTKEYELDGDGNVKVYSGGTGEADWTFGVSFQDREDKSRTYSMTITSTVAAGTPGSVAQISPVTSKVEWKGQWSGSMSSSSSETKTQTVTFSKQWSVSVSKKRFRMHTKGNAKVTFKCVNKNGRGGQCKGQTYEYRLVDFYGEWQDEWDCSVKRKDGDWKKCENPLAAIQAEAQVFAEGLCR